MEWSSQAHQVARDILPWHLLSLSASVFTGIILTLTLSQIWLVGLFGLAPVTFKTKHFFIL